MIEVSKVSKETREILDFVVKKVKEVSRARKESAASMDNAALRENVANAVSEVNRGFPVLLEKLDLKGSPVYKVLKETLVASVPPVAMEQSDLLVQKEIKVAKANAESAESAESEEK